jgi:hypothetical protein
MMPSMKITDRRIMQTTQIATVVVCGLLIGYLSAEVSHSTQDWLFGFNDRGSSFALCS